MGTTTTGEASADRDDEVVVAVPGIDTGEDACELVARVAGVDTVSAGSLCADRVSVAVGVTGRAVAEAAGRCASLNRT